MGVSFFIEAEREVEGLDMLIDGKALAHRQDLDKLAADAGVRPLMEFFSQDPEEAREFLESDDEVPDLEWFAAEDGLTTVRAIISRLQQEPETDDEDQPGTQWIPTPEEVIEDLRHFESVLVRLAAEGVRWHLAIDF